MGYSWHFDKRAMKEFKKLDHAVQKRLVDWLDKNIRDSVDPRQSGKRLKGVLSDYWRYRVGDYRIIADIQDEELIVQIISAKKRSDIYKR